MLNLEDLPFNLNFTLCCGQVFRWTQIGDWWYGVVKDNAFKIRQDKNCLDIKNTNAEFIKKYFNLNQNLHSVYEKINKDIVIDKAIKNFWGLRIVNQDPWECLISYICATYKNINAIQGMLFNMTKKFGCPKDFEGKKFYTFPTPKKIFKAKESDLFACGLGYRAKYVIETAKTVYESDYNFDKLRTIPYNEAKKQLCAFSGVGSKVADCVLLFSLGKNEAFPIDVWVKRAMLNYYSNNFPKLFIKKISSSNSLSNSDYEHLNFFGRAYFGEYAGYAQQYLYHYERVRKNNL